MIERLDVVEAVSNEVIEEDDDSDDEVSAGPISIAVDMNETAADVVA